MCVCAWIYACEEMRAGMVNACVCMYLHCLGKRVEVEEEGVVETIGVCSAGLPAGSEGLHWR